MTNIKTFAVILARGGSKGIPKKNMMDFLGKPLIAWSIEQAKNSSAIEEVYVSSDDIDILKCAEKYGATPVSRSAELSGDQSTSEDGWLDVLSKVKPHHKDATYFFALQATSPVRSAIDLDRANQIYVANQLDTLFSVETIRDHYIWEANDTSLIPSNFSYNQRGMRQNLNTKYLENGSFYIINNSKFLKTGTRHFGKIGVYEMAKFKSIQIDIPDDAKIAEALMKKFML